MAQSPACSGATIIKLALTWPQFMAVVFFLALVGLTSASFVKTPVDLNARKGNRKSNSSHEIIGKTRLRKGVEQREAQCVKLGQKDSWMLSSVAKN